MEPAKESADNAMLQQARALVQELESGNIPAAEGLIERLSLIREQSLFQELGKMTRQLHDSLNSFALDSRMQSLAESDIPDAKARLNHVIEMIKYIKTANGLKATSGIDENANFKNSLILKVLFLNDGISLLSAWLSGY